MGFRFEESFHLAMIGDIAELIADDPHDFAVMNEWIELLEIENVVGDRFWKASFLLPVGCVRLSTRPSIPSVTNLLALSLTVVRGISVSRLLSATDCENKTTGLTTS